MKSSKQRVIFGSAAPRLDTLEQAQPIRQHRKRTEELKHKKAKPSRAQRDFRRFAKIVGSFVYIVVLSAVVVTSHAQVTVTGYELDRAQNRLEELRNENRALEAKAASLASLQHIEEVAIAELGMTIPTTFRPIQIELNNVELEALPEEENPESFHSVKVALKPSEQQPRTLSLTRQASLPRVDLKSYLHNGVRSLYAWFAAEDSTMTANRTPK